MTNYFVTIGLSLPYIYLGMNCLWGLNTLQKRKTISTDKFSHSNVSIIVAFRDDAKNLSYLLDDIKLQTLKPLEIILINDHSTDNFKDVLKVYKDLNILLLHNDGTGKKSALKKGVEQAKGEYCLFTDADCRVGKRWVEIHQMSIFSNQSDMYIAPVEEIHKGHIIQKLQCMEFDSLQAATAGTAALGRAILCSGANLCVRKNVWLKAYNDAKFCETDSGDDMFMLHFIKKNNGSIYYINQRESIVSTETKPSISQFLRQRMRWGGKSTHYEDKQSIMYASIILAFSLSLLSISILSILYPSLWIAFIILMGIKILIDAIVINRYYNIVEKKNSIAIYTIFCLLHPLYIVMSAIGGILGFGRWK